MLRIILLLTFMGIGSSGAAQERVAQGFGVVTSISPQGRELIVGQEIYRLPEQVKMDGILMSRAKVATLLRPGNKVSVELETGRTVKAIRSQLK